MNKRIFLIIVTILLIILSTGCSFHQSNQTTSNISKKDIEDAKIVVKENLQALADGDANAYEKTLTKNHSDIGRSESFNKNHNINLLNITYSEKGTVNKGLLKHYEDYFHETPYKTLSLFTEYMDNNEKFELYFYLVKNNDDSPWLIYDSGV